MAKKAVKQFDLERHLKKSRTAVKEGLTKAKENKGGFAEYDDGKYRFQLRKAEAGKSNSSNRPQVIMTWKFLDGDYKGQLYKSYRGIQNADDFYYLFLDMKRLGYEIDDPADLPELLETLSKDKPKVSGGLVTKGEYQNLRINKLIDGDEDEDDEEDDDDDKPKKKKGKKSKDDDDDDDADEDEDGDDDDEEEEKPKRKGKKKSKSDDEDDEEEEDDDDDEDEKPSRRRKSKKKKDEDEDEEDEDSDDEDEDEEEEEKPKKKRKGKAKDDEDEEEDEDEDEGSDEEVAVTVGSIVKAKLKSGTQKVEVVEILDDEELKVKTKDGKTVKISSDRILDVIEAAPKKKKSKK
jgi:hypothetical protein